MPVTCLPASATASYFSIETSDLCAVAVYAAPDLTLSAFGAVPTWGQHGGPLTSKVMQTGTTATIDLERWSLSGTSLSKIDTMDVVDNISAGAFFTSQVVDFGMNSVIAWSGANFTTDGEMVVLPVGTHVAATGVFGLASEGPSPFGGSRLLYTGLSVAGPPPNDMPGLYLVDFTNPGTASKAIALWGDANGPVAVDNAGNAVAINTTAANGTQEMRGFTASNVLGFTPHGPGDVLLDTAGFGRSLAAVAPTATKPGLALFQPEISSGMNAVAEDVIAVPYTPSMGQVSAMAPVTLLKLATANTSLTLMTDPSGQVWVGAANPMGTGSTFIVLARP